MKLSGQELKKLFSAIGSEQTLRSILLEFYQLMSRDLLIGYFFDGKSLEKIAENQKNFLLKAWGVTKSYSGLSPARAHDELPNILQGHFDRRLILLNEVLDKYGVPASAIKTWIAFENSFRKKLVKEEKARNQQ